MTATRRFVWRFSSDDEAFKQHGAHQTLASLFSAQGILGGKCSLATGKAKCCQPLRLMAYADRRDVFAFGQAFP